MSILFCTVTMCQSTYNWVLGGVSGPALGKGGKHFANWMGTAAAYGIGYHTGEVTAYSYSQILKVNLSLPLWKRPGTLR